MGAPPNTSNKQQRHQSLTTSKNRTTTGRESAPPCSYTHRPIRDERMDAHGCNRQQQQQQQSADHSKSINDAADMTTLPTYLALVQQYLAVFMVDNAIFLVERCLAEYPSSKEAIYLQAACYYRKGNYVNCRAILDRQSSSTWTSNMAYLSAQCSFELRDYRRAEEVLMKQARESFKQQRDPSTSAATLASIDEFILHATPCPVPNGAAGVALLGQICRKSGRRELAIKFLKISLQLDPFLWTSFAALAELNADDIDPAAVFGVNLPATSTAGSVTSVASNAEGHHATASNAPPAMAMKTPLQPKETPKQTVGAWQSGVHRSSTLLRSDLRSFDHHQHHSQAQGANRAHRGLHHPLINLDTPGLTPIPVNSSSYVHHVSFVQGTGHVASTPVTGVAVGPAAAGVLEPHPGVVRRASQVAARQYYPPSPEIASVNDNSGLFTPSLSSVTRSMQYLRGLGPSFRRQYQGDHDGNSPTKMTRFNPLTTAFQHEGRSLFMSTSENHLSFSTSDPTSSSTRVNQNRHANTAMVLSRSNPLKQDTAQDDAVSKPVNEGKRALDDGNDIETNVNRKSVQGILEMLVICGAAYQHVCRYQCHEALTVLQHVLPRHQQTTAWSLHMQGKAYLELNDFSNAQRCLEHMQSVEPGRMQGLELLSTVYWQQKREVELAHLAQRVVEWDRLSPQAWCVVGNCFSLQKDHEAALRFFQRSLQIDPDFTYTHTLSGYEYMSNEDFEKATTCFRHAIRSDDRHYNAWYGLGAIYHRQEKFELAAYHFKRAVSIHPSSSVLLCNLAIAQHSHGDGQSALQTLAEALRLDPRNPQAHFQRATVCSALNRWSDALVALEKVVEVAPRESTVYLAMGKILKRLHRKEEAMKCFLTAMDLDPKDSQLIKAAMDKLDHDDMDEENVATF